MTIRKLSSVIIAVMLITACGTKIIRGAAPIVRMNELSQMGDSISLQLSMRNLNGVALDIQAIDFDLSVEGKNLLAFNGPAKTNITANGTETWSVEVSESQPGRQLLEKLQAGDIISLPYYLEGSVTTTEGKKLRFNQDGHIYPVPGRPGHFR